MTPLPIVINETFENRVSQHFGLQGVEERLGRGVVPAITLPISGGL
jgi:hypothetical protein